MYCRTELSTTQKELDKAKEMYVLICEEKDKLEDNIDKRFQEQIEKEVQEVLLIPNFYGPFCFI